MFIGQDYFYANFGSDMTRKQYGLLLVSQNWIRNIESN